MKLIFIYGPPASGKLTVAKELAKVTGYKVFHNHLTVDLVGSVFDFDHPMAGKLRQKYRLEIIEAATKEKIKGLIFTFVYYARGDNPFVRKVVRRVEKYGGEVLFVKLACNERELIKRLKHPSRKIFGKIKNPMKLKTLMSEHDLFARFNHKNHLEIENTKMSPKKTAKKIKEFYKI